VVTEYVYAAAILHELDREMNESNTQAVSEAAGADVSESRVKAPIAALEGVDLDRTVDDTEPSLPTEAEETTPVGEIEDGDGDESEDGESEAGSDLPESTGEGTDIESDSGGTFGGD